MQIPHQRYCVTGWHIFSYRIIGDWAEGEPIGSTDTCFSFSIVNFFASACRCVGELNWVSRKSYKSTERILSQFGIKKLSEWQDKERRSQSMESSREFREFLAVFWFSPTTTRRCENLCNYFALQPPRTKLLMVLSYFLPLFIALHFSLFFTFEFHFISTFFLFIKFSFFSILCWSLLNKAKGTLRASCWQAKPRGAASFVLFSALQQKVLKISFCEKTQTLVSYISSQNVYKDLRLSV